jgi:hypothetical protein
VRDRPDPNAVAGSAAASGPGELATRTCHRRFERRFGRTAATAVRATEAPPSEPAILNTTVSAADIPKLGLNGSTENGVALTVQWLAAGRIVHLSLCPGNPLTMSGSQSDLNLNCADLASARNAT